MDGTLLDHYTYEFTPIQELLMDLKEHHIPIIPITSKTCAEMDYYCNQLGLVHGYGAENGAIVKIENPKFAIKQINYNQNETHKIQRSFAKPASHWRKLISKIRGELKFSTFNELSDSEVAALTGLSIPMARLARTREFGEVIHWQDTEKNLDQFKRSLERNGACLFQGGRFLHVTGDADKGMAMNWIVNHYSQVLDIKPVTIVAGDSKNDIPMLSRADVAVVVRSPVHPPPVWSQSINNKQQKVITTVSTGPAGWKDGMLIALEYVEELLSK